MHYLSDSPPSQYQNATMFMAIQRHEELFQVKATCNYFESGHGKGPCDGVGGSVKRSADLAIKKGLIIKMATDFYKWGIKQEHSLVIYRLVSMEEVTQATEELTAMGKIPIPGTMKLHSVVPVGTQLYTREASCFSRCCWSGATFHHRCEGVSVGCFTPYRQLGSFSRRKQVLTYSVLVENKFGPFQSGVIESMR